MKFPRCTATVICIAVFTFSLGACNKAPSAAPPNEIAVSGNALHFAAGSPVAKRLLTAPVVSAQEGVLSLPARIVWDEDHTSRIMPPISGRLADIMVQPGALVKAGQPIANLNSPEIGSAQTDAARAQAELVQAERNLARTKVLADAGVAAGKDLEQAQADLERTRAEAARTGLRLKSLGAASTVDQHLVLRSPIAGVVVERNTNPGMEWRPDQSSTPLFVISDPTYLWCWINAPERALGMLRPGMEVKLRSSAWPQETFTARIDYVADTLDPASRTMRVRARLRNPQRHLKGEMYVTAELPRQAQGALDVPAKAVFLNNGQQQVFVKTAEGQFARKTITPVAVGDTWVSVDQGLNKGDEVVVDGALYLQKLLDESAAQAPPVQPGAMPQSAAADKQPAR
ncbi:MAG: efflux RND transporter periplasmic adaptor subunit [Pseudomonadota bacterium]